MNARRLERFEGLLNAERSRIQQVIKRLQTDETAGADAAASGDDVAAGALGVAPDVNARSLTSFAAAPRTAARVAADPRPTCPRDPRARFAPLQSRE